MTRRSTLAVGLVLAGAAFLALAGPAGAAEIKIGGYTKLDLIWADKITDNGGTSSVAPPPRTVPLDGVDVTGDHNTVILDARETRLNFTGTGEVSGVKLRGFVEGDFFTDEGNRNVSNSRGLRLRHAFGQATLPGGFFILGGQTWSTFMNLDTAPPTRIDFNSPVGTLFNREPQLRVGFKTGALTVMTAVESHSVFALGTLPATGTPPANFVESQQLPLFVAKALWASKLFTAEVAGAVSENRAIFAAGNDETDTAWGVQGGVKVPIGPLTIIGHVQRLSGLTRLANAHFRDAVVDNAAGTIKNIRTLGWFAGASYALTQTTTFNAVYNWAEADEESFYTGAKDERLRSLHVNILQKLWGNMQAGLEYERKTREQFNGLDGDLNRIHAAWWYFF